ncbi:hypothetical protein ES703_48213 [subsurface metagenome]
MKIDTWILLRSRQAKRKKISESKVELTFNKGIYLMNRDAINFFSKDGKPKGVETYFYEGNPAPIKIDKAGSDTSIIFLDRYIYENVIEQTGAQPKERISGAFIWARDNLSIGFFIKWGFLLLIVGAMVGGQLGLF